MRSRYLFIVAAVVLLAGCGGIAGPGENGTANVTDPGEEVSGVNQSNSDTDPKSETQPEANLVISEIEVDRLMTYNQTQSGSVSVENAGGESGAGNLSVMLRDRQLVSEAIELDAGETIEVEFETGRLRYPEGDYVIQATLNAEFVEQEFSINHPSPYGSTDIDLYVDDSATDRKLNESVSEAISYWEENDEAYLGYEVEYHLVDSETQADKVLTFEAVGTCGTEIDTGYLGCADLVRSNVDDPVRLSVDPRTPNPVVTDTLIHEIGHTHGLEHGEEPGAVMRESYDVFESLGSVKFHVRSSSGSVPDDALDEIEEALDFYQSEGAFEYALVNSAADAHYTVTFDSRGTQCGFSGGGSCLIDGEHESQIDIRLEQLDSEVVAWHLGYNLAGPAVDRLPEGLDTEERDEREDWPQ
ncbi:hypothetical protein [Halorubrum saccharovorum]|uniref:hypothetical protein n=1 Tax=Halorubrum saccharovorum TaxID=2248 RepID=UPI00126940F3|nr:hypothetical protein [Halorubrum saccharovorum]